MIPSNARTVNNQSPIHSRIPVRVGNKMEEIALEKIFPLRPLKDPENDNDDMNHPTFPIKKCCGKKILENAQLDVHKSDAEVVEQSNSGLMPKSTPSKKWSCAALFPDTTSSVVTSFHWKGGRGDENSKTLSQLALPGEKYPTEVLHGPPTIYHVQYEDDTSHSATPAFNPTPSITESGGVTIEEIVCDDQKSSFKGKEPEREGFQHHHLFAPSHGTASPLKNSSVFLRMRMPPIPEDSPVPSSAYADDEFRRNEGDSLLSTPCVSGQILRGDQRIPSFHTVSRPQPNPTDSPSPPRKERRIACFNFNGNPNKTSRKGTTKTSQNNKLSRLPKPVCPKRTYENFFLMKKAYIEQGPGAILRPQNFNRQTIAYSSKDGRLEFETAQKAVLTKVVTKTVTEYEVDENGNERQTNKRSKTKSKPVVDRRRSGSCGVTLDSQKSKKQDPSNEESNNRSKKRNKKVIILEEPQTVASNSPSNDSGDITKVTRPPSNKGKGISRKNEHVSSNEKGVSQTEKRVGSTEMEKVVLPGHGDPLMEVPPVKTPGYESGVESTGNDATADEKHEATRISPRSTESIGERKRKARRAGECRRCKVYKTMVRSSEDTIRYLTELLNIKGGTGNTNDLEERNASKRSALITTLLRRLILSPAGTNDPAINPLFARIQMPEPTDTSSQSGLPKFNLDEFVQKFFRSHIWCSEHLEKMRGTSPFDVTQLFRVVIAARDCISHDILHKLKLNFVELQRRYEHLMPSESGDTEMSHERVELVNSYRRFLRYIYFYLKESLKVIENFELKMLPSSETNLKRKNGRPMYHETDLTLQDGFRYYGVFIPFNRISGQSSEQ